MDRQSRIKDLEINSSKIQKCNFELTYSKNNDQFGTANKSLISQFNKTAY